ncbi:MAG TPA: SGNH/GDSL hydrolase family protein [Pseudonocardiaceae bacterium]
MSDTVPAHQRKRRRRSLVIGTAGIVGALVATSLVLSAGRSSAASPGDASMPTPGEAAAGALAFSQSYPGGLPALLNLFDTGECAGVQSNTDTPPQCASILHQIAQLGAGQSFPGGVPDLSGSTDQTVPPQDPPDPSDQITPDMISAMQSAGAPPDLIAALEQNPPDLPAAYNTLPHYQGGPNPAAPHAPGPAPSTGTDQPPTTPPLTTPPTTAPPTTPPTSPPPTTPPPTTGPPTSSTTMLPTSTTTTFPTPSTTFITSTMPPPPPPPPPPLLVAVGDSVTSGHVAQQVFGPLWRTTCDNPGTGAAAPGTSWAGNLRALLGVPWNRYFNFAHSGASTTDVLATVRYTNPCGVVSQPVRPQIGDATAVLAANPSKPGAANVAVATAGVNDTNWTTVATQLIARQIGGVVGRIAGRAPAWAVANVVACNDFTFGNPAGNPGAPAGAVPPAWNGVAASGGIAANAASISLRLIQADPGAQVRYLLYYRWIRDLNLPNVCNLAQIKASTMLNGWISFGVLVARIVWWFLGGNPARVRAVCQQLFNPGPASLQMRITSWGIANWALVPGYPHPDVAGRATLAGCVNGTLPKAVGGGVA